MPAINEVIQDSEDELDFLSSATPTLVASGSATPFERETETPISPKRVLRTRSNISTVLKISLPLAATLKRKRTLSDVGETKPTAQAAGKKSKVEDKKLVRVLTAYMGQFDLK